MRLVFRLRTSGALCPLLVVVTVAACATGTKANDRADSFRRVVAPFNEVEDSDIRRDAQTK